MINHVKLALCLYYMIRTYNTEQIMVVNYYLEKGRQLLIIFNQENVFQEGVKLV